MNSSVVLRELPPSITLAEAYSVLCHYGEVIDCSMLQRLRRNHPGHSQLGLPQFEAQVAVLYASPEAAHYAVAEMHNSRTAFAHPGMSHLPLIAELASSPATHHASLPNQWPTTSMERQRQPQPQSHMNNQNHQNSQNVYGQAAPHYAARGKQTGGGGNPAAYMPPHAHPNHTSPNVPGVPQSHQHMQGGDAVGALQNKVEQLQRKLDMMEMTKPDGAKVANPAAAAVAAATSAQQAAAAAAAAASAAGQPAPPPGTAAPYGSQAPHVLGEGRVFVGNLPLSTQQRKLAAMFQPYGDLLEVFVFRRPQAETGGRCAFVRFADIECAKRAVAHLNGVQFMDREILVKMAPRKAGGGNNSNPPPNGNVNVNINMGGSGGYMGGVMNVSPSHPNSGFSQQPFNNSNTSLSPHSNVARSSVEPPILVEPPSRPSPMMDCLESGAVTTEGLSDLSSRQHLGPSSLLRLSRSVEYIRNGNEFGLRSELSEEHARSYLGLGLESPQALSSAESVEHNNQAWANNPHESMTQIIAQLAAMAAEVPERGDWKGGGNIGGNIGGIGIGGGIGGHQAALAGLGLFTPSEQQQKQELQ